MLKGTVRFVGQSDLCQRIEAHAYLIKLGPGNHHVAEILIKVGLIKDLLCQEVLVVLVQVVLRPNLRCKFAVESVVHHPPWHAVRHHKGYSVLMAVT